MKEAVATGRQWVEALPESTEAMYELGSAYLDAEDKVAALAAQRKLAEIAEKTKKAGVESESERYAKLLLDKINQ